MTVELASLLLLVVLVPTEFVCVTAKLASPSISAPLSSSFIATFNYSRDGSVSYDLIVAPRHGSEKKKKISNYINGTKVTGLRADTLYDVTVISNTGDCQPVVEMSDSTVARTLPLPPDLTLKTALENSVIVFFNMANRAQVSGWTIQYREEGNASSLKTEVSDKPYAYWLSGLTANTRYEIRVRLSQLRGSQSVSEVDTGFSDWKVFTTGRLSVYGRVDLTNVTFNGSKAQRNTKLWNTALGMLRDSYASINGDRIDILRIEQEEERARVHYRIEVDDKTLVSNTNYSLIGEGFSNSLINIGGIAVGTPYYLLEGTKHTLLYTSNAPCSKIVERYFIVTPENDPPEEIHLNVASSDATTPTEDDSLLVKASGDIHLLQRDDGLTSSAVKSNTVVALTPKFVVKNCLDSDPENQSMYSELLFAQNFAGGVTEHIIFILTGPSLNSSDIVYTSSKNWSFYSIHVPAVGNVVKYQILHSGEVLGSLEEEELDSSSTWKIIPSKYVPNTTYDMVAAMTFRKPDGSDSAVENLQFSVTPGGPQCGSCADKAICSTRVGDGSVTCTCMEGFKGDGVKCVPETEAEQDTVIDPSDFICSSSNTWAYFTLDVTILDQVIEYKLLQIPDQIEDTCKVIGTLGKKDLENSNSWKILMNEYVPNATYNIVASVTFRKDDGSNYTAQSSVFTCTPDGPQCGSCSNHSICSTRVGDDNTECSCLGGFSGNGTSCQKDDVTVDVTVDGSWKIYLVIIIPCIFLLLLVLLVCYLIRKKKRRGTLKIQQQQAESMKLQVKQESQQTSKKSDCEESLQRDDSENV